MEKRKIVNPSLNRTLVRGIGFFSISQKALELAEE
jgi:hypothetical protein